ncbi:hypothetical protein CMK18_21165 [Candidatus Poribacteria bacterium]|nr:hypothetical protein [Candidatus Poribacteria bacterium]
MQSLNLKDRFIPKIQSDEDKIIHVEEIKTPTAEDLKVFRNQLRIQVEGELDIDTKKSVLNSLIKKLKVDQNGLLEIDFGVALGNTPYPVLPRANNSTIYFHT